MADLIATAEKAVSNEAATVQADFVGTLAHVEGVAASAFPIKLLWQNKGLALVDIAQVILGIFLGYFLHR